MNNQLLKNFKSFGYGETYDKILIDNLADWLEEEFSKQQQKYIELQKNLNKARTESLSSLKAKNVCEYLHELRFNPQHHLGLGDIRLTMAQQEEIINMVEKQPKKKSILPNIFSMWI